MQLTQIGVVHSPFDRASGTPVQPFCAAGTEGHIEGVIAQNDVYKRR